LKPDWTFRWLLDPAQISPGTAMPTGLFRKEGDRWVINVPNPPASANEYQQDHAALLVRYMLLMTPDEQRRLSATSPVAPAANTSSQTTGNLRSPSRKRRNNTNASKRRHTKRGNVAMRFSRVRDGTRVRGL
jgi:hypothetical protein